MCCFYVCRTLQFCISHVKIIQYFRDLELSKMRGKMLIGTPEITFSHKTNGTLMIRLTMKLFKILKSILAQSTL